MTEATSPPAISMGSFSSSMHSATLVREVTVKSSAVVTVPEWGPGNKELRLEVWEENREIHHFGECAFVVDDYGRLLGHVNPPILGVLR